MRKIEKGAEPASLKRWKRHTRGSNYSYLPGQIRQEIRESCIKEQNGLCAYCCEKICTSNCHNEHIEPQAKAHNRTLDYSNIVASCNCRNQCGSSHGHKDLPLTPLMPECELELKYYISGHVKGLTPRARSTISILNLGSTTEENRSIVGKRKTMIEALLYCSGVEPCDLLTTDNDLLEILLDDLVTCDESDHLQSFSPILVNIIQSLLNP